MELLSAIDIRQPATSPLASYGINRESASVTRRSVGERCCLYLYLKHHTRTTSLMRHDCPFSPWLASISFYSRPLLLASAKAAIPTSALDRLGSSFFPPSAFDDVRIFERASCHLLGFTSDGDTPIASRSNEPVCTAKLDQVSASTASVDA